MIWWGVIWGAVAGLLLARDEFAGLIVGAVLGALAGLSFRSVVDRRVTQMLARERAAHQSTAAREEAGPEQSVPATVASAPPTGQASPAAATVGARSPVGAPVAVDAARPPAPSQAPLQQPPWASAPGESAAAYRAPATPVAAAADAAAAGKTAAGTRVVAAARSRPLDKSEPGVAEQFVARVKAWLLGGNTVARLGSLVLFMGLAFLARYAAEKGLVPPELRLAGIGVVAIGLLIAGFRLRDKRSGYALTLQGAGVAILYLTLFAAFRLYAFLPPLLAFGLMVAVCALSAALALLQDVRALAVIGAAGGFLAPILASTGQGDHVALFTYYTVLNLGILGIAYRRDWRMLNVVGFVFTFGIGAAWGADRYVPAMYASTQPFLVVYFVLYVAIAVLFALRRAPRLNDYVDGTLVFGTPLVGFGLQAGLVHEFEYGLAWSALALAAFYLVLAGMLMRRHLQTLNMLVESFLALGVIFASLAVPLALDARWTAAAWALEGAALLWVGVRQGRAVPRCFGVLLQLGAWLAFVVHLDGRGPQAWPLLNAEFTGAALLAAAAIFSAWQLEKRRRASGTARGYAAVEAFLVEPLFLVGFAWWLAALALELSRRVVPGVGESIYAVATDDRVFPFMAGYVLSAALACWRGVRMNWRVATWPAYASLPLMVVLAVIGSAELRHVFEHYGWICWPLAIAAHLRALAWIDAREPHAAFAWTHAIGPYLLVLLAGSLANALIDGAALWRTSWGPAAFVVLVAALVGALSRFVFSAAFRTRWPLSRFARAYGWLALGPVVALLLAAALLMVVTQRGDASPLPHVPFVNPTDLAFLLALAAAWFWRSRLHGTEWALPGWLHDRRVVFGLLGAGGFIWINTIWLRAVHHYGGVPWRAQALFDSFVVQTGYALLWTAIAMALMVFGSRRALRALWLTGAALLGATVLKLFLVDLSNAGGTERIVAFVGVGALMLLVGYLAPLPPPTAPVAATDPEPAR
ncbi:MAG TPA: DUF2339 domain-containing protein [Burkholderiaceae bacterium]|nr:DUF2339 domain-containing protein [Burkholderiaceae bacterium]